MDEDYPKDNPFRLIRTWGPDSSLPDEETFGPQLVWKRDGLLERIRRGSISWDTAELTEAEYEQVLPVITRRFEEEMEESRRITGD
ncbi:hypothetical protein [Kutzneria sp. NPDC052558]|uniref:hypothetical protein n=1 Tax=Kutzneria sp. NPDC052558 TaxID=3364121 RepID=UPI0037C61057